MREMKDSGVEWIGELPLDWICTKMKYKLLSCDGGVWGDDPTNSLADSVVIRSTEQTVDGKWKITEPAKRNLSGIKNLTKVRICKGDLLMTKSSGSALHIGKTTLADDYFTENECYYSNFIQRIRVSILPEFAWYILNSPLSREQFVYLQNSTSGIGNINAENIANIYIPVPSLAEQTHIVDLLNTKCAQVDTLIANVQAQIEKLKVYKQSVITESVTKGLDPTAPMKDSGVEWLGEVPAHWGIFRIANLYAERSESGLSELPILTVSINSGVSDHEIADKDKDRVFIRMEDRTKYKRVCPGDLTYNMMRAWQGAFGAVRVDGLVSPAYVVAKPKNEIPLDSRYIEALLRTPVAIEEMHRYSRGIIDFRLRLYWPEFKNIQICLPPLDEQTQIADYIDELASKVDSLIAIKQAKIEKLEQYKRSLIYEYVTGKREVN